MEILLTIAYDGASYSGWQRQANALTVQQVLEDILAKIMERPVTLRAASRTDAGVHALGQRAAFYSDGLKIPVGKLSQVLNGFLPPDISVTAAEAVPDGFVPRFNARQKTYRYQIYNAPYPNPLLRRYSAFVPQKLDWEAMRQAAPYFIGRHDFRAFRAAAPGQEADKSTVREIYSCFLRTAEPCVKKSTICKAIQTGVNQTNNILDNNKTLHPIDFDVSMDSNNMYNSFCAADGNDGLKNILMLYITGNGFLYNMVRIIAGTVLYAGMGKIRPGEIPDIIASGERKCAGKTMPPEGLTLMEIVF
jgi:tRNA pseudouridine38-40 synthase